jgi:hypothetical protein
VFGRVARTAATKRFWCGRTQLRCISATARCLHRAFLSASTVTGGFLKPQGLRLFGLPPHGLKAQGRVVTADHSPDPKQGISAHRHDGAPAAHQNIRSCAPLLVIAEASAVTQTAVTRADCHGGLAAFCDQQAGCQCQARRVSSAPWQRVFEAGSAFPVTGPYTGARGSQAYLTAAYASGLRAVSGPGAAGQHEPVSVRVCDRDSALIPVRIARSDPGTARVHEPADHLVVNLAAEVQDQ